MPSLNEKIGKELPDVNGREMLVRQVFDDYEARANFVGFFDLLYKVDRRLEPERYEDGADLP